MRKVSEKDRLFYFEKNFFTLDGLWMIETEAETDWKTALKIDLLVWTRLLKIIIRRIKNYLGIESNSIKDLVEILIFRWSCEKWDYSVDLLEDKKASIRISRCPYKEIMSRNPEREDRIPLICEYMCLPFYEEIIKDFNPNIKLRRDKFQGLGDDYCNFELAE